MEETCTRCLILVRDEFTDRWNGIEMPDWSRVSSIELERTDDSSINSYSYLRDCCHRFVSLEQFQLPVSCGLFLQIFWKSQATRHKEQHSDTLHEIHFCTTWDSERSEERQWSTILITQVQKVCGRMAEFSPHNDKSISAASQRTGRTSCTDSQEPTDESQTRRKGSIFEYFGILEHSNRQHRITSPNADESKTKINHFHYKEPVTTSRNWWKVG